MKKIAISQMVRTARANLLHVYDVAVRTWARNYLTHTRLRGHTAASRVSGLEARARSAAHSGRLRRGRENQKP